MNARFAAFDAVRQFLKSGIYLEKSLGQFRNQLSPTDFRLAQEIAYGSTRMALSLDWIAARLHAPGRLALKREEKALLRTALYQAVFMDRIPLYALCNDTVSIAKKWLHSSVAKFFNMLLRKLIDGIPALPCGSLVAELAIRYSFPEKFIADLMDAYGLEKTRILLDASNLPGKITYRDRELPFSVDHCHVWDGKESLESIGISARYYIQNLTPITLIEALAKNNPLKPKTILDMCCAPGGKLLAAHDLYPSAELFVNDMSSEKIEQIQSNVSKYGLNVHFRCGPGETYPLEQKFDLIIVDVPCSNSGVFNKRPEARWRYSEENLMYLEKIQQALLDRAHALCAPGGQIWYLTCSILPRENGDVVRNFLEKHPSFGSTSSNTIFPNGKELDGGYAALLIHN